jgi:hypothetical protein
MLQTAGGIMTFTQSQYAHEVVLGKAVDVCGGLTNLAYVLDRTREDLCRWIAGVEPIPDDVMREVLTVVSCIQKW